ncbi:hypothetical protein OV760_29985, partial [Salmonella enterica subsp. enterica serovar 1,4,[5],12:i:-]|nr:hypothetical protein [Salmonella enterica subsp. enterica serovar 1,4,[5],12:i:-]
KEVVENIHINSSTKIIYIRNKTVSPALINKFIKKTRVLKAFIEISVARGIPPFRILVNPTDFRNRKQSILIYSWIATL